MRVVVCTDAIGGLASARAGAALGRAFLDASGGRAQVAVVPMGASGDALAEALRALGRDDVVIGLPADEAVAWDSSATSGALGLAVRAALTARPRRLVVEIAGASALDGGAGLLAALGATASGAVLDGGATGLAGLRAVDLSGARAMLGDAELVGIVPDDSADDLLLGLRGIASRRGRATSADHAAMLALDDSLAGLASALQVADAPGVGACGGAGLAIVALGGTLTTGVRHCADAAGLDRTAGRADLVVTGSDTIGFADRGGPVIRSLTKVAERALRPCVAVAREVHVSARELRTFGLESAHALGGGPVLTPAELAARASGVARTWTW